MSYFDPMMVSDPPPKGWFDYVLHTEVNEREFELIQYLEKTKWVYFANGGYIEGNRSGVDESSKTRWCGLKREVVKQ